MAQTLYLQGFSPIFVQLCRGRVTNAPFERFSLVFLHFLGQKCSDFVKIITSEKFYRHFIQFKYITSLVVCQDTKQKKENSTSSPFFDEVVTPTLSDGRGEPAALHLRATAKL